MQTRESGAREISWLNYALSKLEVDQHGLERDRMHDSIKYNAAVDSLAQQKEFIRHLSKYIDAERHVNRDVVRQNVALVRTIEHMADVIQKKSSQVKKSQGMLDCLMKEIDIKDNVLRSTQNQLLLAQSRYDEKVMESHQQQAPAVDPVFQSLMKEYGLTKTEVVSNVKEYLSMDHKALQGQEKKVASLEKKVSSLQNTCKEEEKKRKQAEKTVKDQKKQLDAKDARIKMLEDSLKAQEEMTPAAPRAVTRAMEAVGNIMAELGGITPSTNGKNTPKPPHSRLKRHSEEGSLMSASAESTGRGSVSKRRLTVARSTGKEEKHSSGSLVNKAEPSHEADVSIWNPDSDKNLSDKENPSKMLSFDGKKSAGGVSKRKLLSVSSHNRKQPLMGVTKKNTGFSIPKLNQ